MRRRALLLGGIAGAALAATRGLAQRGDQGALVAAIFGGGAEAMQLYRTALADGLASNGFVEGRNLRIESRVGANVFADDQSAVRALLKLKPDAFFTTLTTITRAAQSVAPSTPIVFAWVADPVGARIVKSFAKPGTNATGVTNRFGELLVKRLELARDLVPDAKRVAVLSASGLLYEILAPPLRAAAARLGVELLEIPFAGWEGDFSRAVSAGAQVVLPFNQFVATGWRLTGELLAQQALERRVPVIFAGAEMVEAGGLISYGTNLVDDIRRGADLLAQVLKGANPADLPVDQAARLELVVNLRIARAIGLGVPQSVLLRADRVIE